MPVAPVLSVNVTIKLKVAPTTAGVPLIFPVAESKDNPGGSLPALTVQFEYGVLPPVGVKLWLYAEPIFPAGNDGAVVIANVEGVTAFSFAKSPSN